MSPRILLVLALVLLALSYASPRAGTLAGLDSLLQTSGTEPTLARIDSLLPIARERDDSPLLLGLLRRQGFLFATFGHSHRAEAALGEARGLAEAAGDSLQLSMILRWLGVALDGLGRPTEAQATYRKLLELAEARGDSLHQGWAEVGLAWRDSQSGLNAEAASHYRRAIELFQGIGEVRGRIWSLNGLGISLSRQGNRIGATEAFEEVAVIAQDMGDIMVEALARNNLGTLFFDRGIPGLAMEHFARARDLQIELIYRKGAFLPAFNVALCLLELGRLDEAEADYEALLAEAREERWPDYTASVLGQLGTLAGMRGRHHLAANRFREALSADEVLPLKREIEMSDGLARALVAVGDADSALAILTVAERKLEGTSEPSLNLFLGLAVGRVLQSMRRHEEALARFEAVDLNAESLGKVGPRVEAISRAARSLTALGRDAEALDLLREGAAVWDAERGLPRDPEWRERFGSSGHMIYTDLALALLAPREGEDSETRAATAFDQLQRFKARTLLERMLGNDENIAPVKLIELQEEVLAEGELLLDLYLGPERSLLFAVDRDHCRARILPGESDLSPRLRKLHSFLSRPPVAGKDEVDESVIRAAAAALDESLFGGIDSLIAAHSSVILVPDGALNLMAPALLGRGDGSAAWTRVPSATLLARLRAERSESTRGTGRGLALAGADSSGSEDLPGARREVAFLADRFTGVDSRLLSDVDSSEAARDLLADSRFLHLATHASLNDQNPWQSGLHLGPAGSLRAAEIARGEFEASLAVLAACSSGSGRLLSGEGVLGLASAFLAAGVPTVVATLWPVDDAATARFSEFFYDALAEGRGAGQSLQRAQQRLAAEPGTAHPFFWSGFILVGDGRPGLELSGRPFLAREGWRVAMMLGAAVLLMLAILGMRIKRPVDL